ncbi:unnamed protein product [Miscanthus lutarioriparius]|uniref:Uncharacterized protein n=1 Tax=Miscanthus lutarioriparius TaxID=422564 RepID=A0A811Q613_9POAL|nr:unnamed protein product [Miscanthus lutarioriparius]
MAAQDSSAKFARFAPPSFNYPNTSLPQSHLCTLEPRKDRTGTCKAATPAFAARCAAMLTEPPLAPSPRAAPLTPSQDDSTRAQGPRLPPEAHRTLKWLNRTPTRCFPSRADEYELGRRRPCRHPTSVPSDS